MGRTEADNDRQRHGPKEEYQRSFPDPVHLVVGAQVGDADDDGREDQRHQNHAQQVEEQVADDFGAIKRVDRNGCRPGGNQPQAAGDADDAADQYLRVERSLASHAIGPSNLDDIGLYPVIMTVTVR